MDQFKLRAVFMRGGTSRALMFRQSDLPDDRSKWAPIFLAAMGSPDPNGRQIDGMGGGISSLSKVCVVGPPSRPDADVDFTFAQVSIREAIVDYSGNCGNMSSAIGPFAIQEGMVAAEGNEAVVRIHNTNTCKIIVSRFPLAVGEVVVDGDFQLPGIAGAGAPIRLEFEDPGGARTGRLLPTGAPLDQLAVPGFDGPIEASLVDAANPCVFVLAQALSKDGTELPDALDGEVELLARLEAIRRVASVQMGLSRTLEEAAGIPSVPKVAMVSPPRRAAMLSGGTLDECDMDVAVRMISIGQPHRAVPLTGAMCLAVASRVEGTLVHRVTRKPSSRDDDLRIGQPSGLTVVAARVRRDIGWVAESAVVYRTARRLMEGFVFVRASRIAYSST